MTDKLLPCPFCGGEARGAHEDYGDTHYWRVYCDTIGCVFGISKVFHSEAEAVAAWNARAELGSEPPYDELLRCLENDWHIKASWDGLRKFWCIELTEEGVKLRDATHGTLTAEQVCEAIYAHSIYADCTDADWQAIADELNARAERTCRAESALHENPYVGLVRGKQWERTEISDYYCGRCGWKVTDHDSYCPECGGALHGCSSKVRDGVTNIEWYAKNEPRKLCDLGIDGNMSCDDCPNQCVETEEGTPPEECQRRLLEWLMAPHEDAQQDTPNQPNSQSDAPKTAQTGEISTSKVDIRDFDDSREEIVRCRDCTWFHWDDSGRWCAQSLVRRGEPDGFCAWAERRDA